MQCRIRGLWGRTYRSAFTFGLVRCAHLPLPLVDPLGVVLASPRVGFVGKEGGLTLFAGLGEDDEFSFVLLDIV